MNTLCRLTDIPDGGSNGFVAETPDGTRKAILAVRKGERVFAYVNNCPHIGAPLDFSPGRFLNLQRTMILCSTHGALFRIHDGFCVQGPCAGKSLQPVPTVTENGWVRMTGPGNPG